MPSRLTVLVPSRGRPENVARLKAAFTETARFAELAVFADEDDVRVSEYEALADEKCSVTVGPRLRLGGTLNTWAPVLAEENEILGFMGDDHLPRTLHWDEVIASKMRKNRIVYGNDLLQGAALPTAVFMDSNIVTTLGFMVLPGQIHLFMDNFWKSLGEKLGTLKYLPDVIIEHLHYSAGKTGEDQTYVEANSSANWSNDQAIYEAWMREGWQADVEKLRNG